MNLAVNPPVLPMLAKRVSELPPGEGWIFEPKWDGFRTLVFRDGDEVFIQSRDEKPLNRYFPELIDPLKAQLPQRCVLDGEIVIAADGGLEFDTLQMRLHPAESRVRKLAVEIPASIVFFDVLAEDSRSLCETPFSERRARLEAILSKVKPPLHITPATRDRATAADWFRRFEGAGLDGVVAKPEDGTYEPNKRVMLKVKHEREADCVVAGFRWHKTGGKTKVGSLFWIPTTTTEISPRRSVQLPDAKRTDTGKVSRAYRANARRSRWRVGGRVRKVSRSDAGRAG
jgi:ATP-dependent DNA ligase